MLRRTKAGNTSEKENLKKCIGSLQMMF